MPEDKSSPRQDGRSSPKSPKVKSSFQRELEDKLKDRKKRGLSAGFSDLEVTEDSDDGIGSDDDDLLGQFNMTMRPKRTDRPGSAKPRGGMFNQTMWRPPVDRDKEDEDDGKKDSSPRLSAKGSPKPSPRILRKEDKKADSPSPTPRSRQRTGLDSQEKSPRRLSRSPSPDNKKGRSTDILDLLGDDTSAKAKKSSAFSQPVPKPRPQLSSQDSPGRRDSSPDSARKAASSSLFGTSKTSPEMQRRFSRDSSPTGKKSPLLFKQDSPPSRKKDKAKFSIPDSDDSEDETLKPKRGTRKDLGAKRSDSRSPSPPSRAGRKSPQSPTMRKKGLLDSESDDHAGKLKTKRWQSPTRKTSPPDSDSEDEWRKAEKTKPKKTLLDELQEDGDGKTDKKKKSSFFDTDDDEVGSLTTKGRLGRRSPSPTRKQSPSPKQERRSPPPTTLGRVRSPSPKSQRQASPTLLGTLRTPSPKSHREDDELLTTRRPPSGRKLKKIDDPDEEELDPTRRMRYISTDSDVAKEFKDARERPSTTDRSRSRRRVIKPKVVTRPLSASGRLDQSLTARTDMSSSTMSLSARSTTPNVEDSNSIREAIYVDWYAEKMARAKAEKKAKLQKEKEEQEKKEKEKKDRQLESELTFRAWKEQKEGTLKKKAKEEAKKKEKEKAEKDEKERKKYEAEKLFKSWKVTKDEELIEKQIQKKKEEEKKIRMEERKKKEKARNANSAYDRWKQSADENLQKTHKEKKKQEKQAKEKEETLRRKKEEDGVKAYEEWERQKEIRERLERRRKNSMTRNPVSTAPFRPSGRTVPFGK
ncbi:microtubule-associated protein 9-like [Ptychodera flava]|uniref:microtubule-associated protein 9-like n=1 Tax=Ptychodera flava TaxID=63121 RepID=UPI00396A1532